MNTKEKLLMEQARASSGKQMDALEARGGQPMFMRTAFDPGSRLVLIQFSEEMKFCTPLEVFRNMVAELQDNLRDWDAALSVPADVN